MMKIIRSLVLVGVTVCLIGYARDQRLEMCQQIVDGERHIVIVTCSYNNAQFYKWNLDSVFSQEYNNYLLLYVDDCSTDKTGDLVQEYAIKCGMEDKLVLIRNENRQKALANLYYAIHMCNPTSIIAILDGDDRFAHAQALARINRAYADPNVWLTYGQFRCVGGSVAFQCQPYPQHIIDQNNFRKHSDGPSHLRTFYAGLFHKVKKEDLIQNGEFFAMTYDLAIMFPMLEMARTHFRFIPDVLVDYNNTNPLSDHRVDQGLQRRIDLMIRSKEKYKEIQNPF